MGSPPLITGCGIAVFTQLSGIEMIIYYAPTILTKNHFSTSAALRVSVGLGVTYLVMMIVGLSIVEHVGRRRLTLTMIPGAAIALAVLGVLFIGGGTSHKTIGLIIVCLILFMLFNAGGLQLMGWLTGSEIYPLAVRGHQRAVGHAVDHEPGDHPQPAVDPRPDRCWTDDVALRGLQRRRVAVHLAPDARTDRAQPGTDRGTAAQRAFPAARLQAPESRTGSDKHHGPGLMATRSGLVWPVFCAPAAASRPVLFACSPLRTNRSRTPLGAVK